MKSSRWASEIANIKIEHFDSRSLALLAEEAAIKNEKPIWNVIHNREVDAKKAEHIDINARALKASSKKQALSNEHQWLSNNYNSLSCLVKMLGQLQVIADPLTLVTMGAMPYVSLNGFVDKPCNDPVLNRLLDQLSSETGMSFINGGGFAMVGGSTLTPSHEDEDRSHISITILSHKALGERVSEMLAKAAGLSSKDVQAMLDLVREYDVLASHHEERKVSSVKRLVAEPTPGYR